MSRTKTLVPSSPSLTSLTACVIACAAMGGMRVAAGAADPPPPAPATAAPPRPLNARPDVASMAAAAAYSESHGGRAVLVMQRGEILFEQYAKGWSGDRPHPLASGTKSFNGVLAMCAIEDGLIASLDEKVCETILEWKDDPRKSQITVRHLLTLSSGLQPNHPSLGPQGAGIRDLGEGRDGPIARRVRERMQAEKPADRFAAAVGVPAEARPGERFHYGPSHFYAFGEFLERKLGASKRNEKTYFDYLKARVLVPCEIDVGLDRFAPDAANKPALPSGGHLTAREWARFGEMVRRGGVVGVAGPDGSGERRILAAASLAECFRPSPTNPAYGLTWWILTGQSSAIANIPDTGGIGVRVDDGKGERKSVEKTSGAPAAAGGRTGSRVVDTHGKPIEVVMAAGAGGQRLYVIPQADLVVVRFAAMGTEGASYDDAIFLQNLLGLPVSTNPPVQRSTLLRGVRPGG